MAEEKDKSPRALDPHSRHRVEAQIQDRVDSGYTAPCGWLFRGLDFFFFSQSERQDGDGEIVRSPSIENDQRLHLACNIARFAGAASVASLESPSITHVVINPDTLPSKDITTLRKTLASRPGKKIPHLVSLSWIEESWANRTLLDEESMSPFYSVELEVEIWC